jgi:hypothetical protein
MRKVMLVVCVAVVILGISGCGSAGASSTENVTMQSGQWELVVAPDNGSTTMLLDANLSGTNAQFSATNAQIFQPSQIGLVDSTSPIYCSSLNIDANVKKNNLRANLEWAAATESLGHFGDLSGELAANGQSISNGNYSGGICSVALNPEVSGPQIKRKVDGLYHRACEWHVQRDTDEQCVRKRCGDVHDCAESRLFTQNVGHVRRQWRDYGDCRKLQQRNGRVGVLAGDGGERERVELF